MDVKQDYFEFYGLPRAHAMDMGQLRTRHRQLQQKFHPDRYVTASAAEQRLAMHVTTYLNNAFKTLQSPLERGVYLLELAGLDPLAAENTQMPTDFLLQQIDLREAMEALPKMADTEAAVSELYDQLKQQADSIEGEFASAYGDGLLQQAEMAIRKLQFMMRLQQQLQLEEDILLD